MTSTKPKPPRPAEPIDETVWRNPASYDRLNRRLTFDTVMQYFHECSFYDPNSNNGTLISNINSNQGIANSIKSQNDFNEKLQGMLGIEYVPVIGNEKSSEGPPVWVIRQQKRLGPAKDAVVRLNTFFVIGENIFQAPNVGEIMANRLLSITHRLRTSLDLASTALAAQADAAPSVTSSAPPPSSQADAVANTTSTSMTSSAPPPSSQAVSTPASISGSAPTASQTAPIAASAAAQATLSRTRQDQAMLQHALQMSLTYQDDCLDDHGPLLDNPGILVGSQSQNQTLHGSQGSIRPGTGTGTPAGGVAGGQGGVRGLNVRRALLKR